VSALATLAAAGQPVARLPWERVIVPEAVWLQAATDLGRGSFDLLSLWADGRTLNLALRDPDEGAPVILSYESSAGRFPSVGAFHPAAIRLERAIRDLFGLEPEGLPDTRPWLDHGRWPVANPLSNTKLPAGAQSRYTFLPAEGEGLHQIPVGPVHAGVIEPGHFRFTASGETIVRLEERLGYVHKGIDGLMMGADLAQASKLAGRTSGDSTVAYQFAFARAVEAAYGFEPPARAHYLRGLMAELERIANHLGDIGDICNDASFALMQAHCAVLRERVLRAAQAVFGHRLMRDVILVGGVAKDVLPEGIAGIRNLIGEIGSKLPSLISLYDNTTSLQDRTVGTGILSAKLASDFAAGGFVGRASARTFDARRTLPYAPYDRLAFDIPVRSEGDVNARVWLRFREIEQSLGLMDQLIEGLPPGPVLGGAPQQSPSRSVEGVSLVEGFRGDILIAVRIGLDGRVERCHMRDPSWFQWPLLEAAIEGNIVADFPLCNKSFNCSYSGHDL